MAKIVKQKWMNSVRRTQLRGSLLLLAADGLGALLLWRLFAAGYLLPTVGLAAVLVLGNLWQLRRIRIVRAGADGERRTLQLLRALPREVVVLPDCVLRCKGHESQADYIIVAENGILVLECKHVSGVVSGGMREREWSQVKYRGGTAYEHKRLYNPLLQVQGHAKTLRALLREAGLEAPVQTAVYFSNRNADVRVQSAEIHTAREALPLAEWVEDRLAAMHGRVDRRAVVRLVKRADRN